MRPEIVSGIVTAGQLLAHFSPEVLICVRWLEPDFFLFLKWRIEWPHFRIRFHSQTLKNHLVQQRAILAIVLLTYLFQLLIMTFKKNLSLSANMEYP